MAQFLELRFTPRFKKQLRKLSPVLKKKFEKQLAFLVKNPQHPSLRTKKMGGTEFFEARLDYHNRFIYRVTEDEIWFYSIGPHDEGLGKK